MVAHLPKHDSLLSQPACSLTHTDTPSHNMISPTAPSHRVCMPPALLLPLGSFSPHPAPSTGTHYPAGYLPHEATVITPSARRRADRIGARRPGKRGL